MVLIFINLGSLIVLSSFASSWMTEKTLDSFPKGGVLCFAISFIVVLVHWIKNIFFSLEDWHKTPMFYDQYLAHPDEGSGFEPED